MIPAQPARAAADESPTVVFVNEPDTGPHLFITKTLDNPEDYERYRSSHPDDSGEFYFTLKLNDDFPIRQDYTVLGADGQVLKDPVTGKARTFTALNGTFSLEAGQTACFRNLGVNTRYVVTETKQDRFTQVEPAGEEVSVSGSIPAEGVSRVFVNHFEPAGIGTTTTLKVHKTVSFVPGYTSPETPDFHFVLTVDGEAWGLKPYTVTDGEGLPAGSGITGADGSFDLKGGYTASFPSVPALVQYHIAETDLPEGWRAIGEAAKTGPLTAPQTQVYFTNAQASFAVFKEMKAGQSSDDEFRFRLGRADGSDWDGAEYYLYDRSTREPMEEPPVVHETGSDGTFSLKQEQMAVFIGVESGTGYSVRELPNADYRQLWPSQADGYPDETVGNSIEPLRFRNEKLEKSGTFSVTKEVVNLKGGDPDPETEFRFVVFRKKTESPAVTAPNEETVPAAVEETSQTAEAAETSQITAPTADTEGSSQTLSSAAAGGALQSEALTENAGGVPQTAIPAANTEEAPQSAVLKQSRRALQTAAAGDISSEVPAPPEGYEFAANLSYQIYEGNISRPGSTDAQGVFTLKANETAHFDAPPFGEYIVREIVLPGGYTAEATEVGPKEVKRGGENVAFTFRNTYREDLADLNLTKTSRTGQTLEGVRFRLYRAEGTPTAGTDWTAVTKIEIGTAVSAADGTFTFTGLSSGTYYLEETETVVGYQLPQKPWTITIARAADHTGLTVTVNDPTADAELTTLTPMVSDTDRDVISLTIQNDVLYALPSTGGEGTAPLRLTGLLLMLAACGLGLGARKRRVR